VCALGEVTEPRVVLLPNGGAFGGRASGETAALAAWAAARTDRPVRLCWTHETATLRQRTRPATRLHLTLRATPSGELRSLELDAIVDGGATPAGARATADGLAAAITGPYTIPHLSTRVRIVSTAARATVGLRGAGLAQATFARETALDTLAQALAIDPTDLRKNTLALEARGLLDDAPSVLASLPPRTPDAGAAAVVVDNHGVRLELGVGDDGQGLHDLAASQFAAISGVPEDLVRIAATDAATVPAGSAAGTLAAVEALADELAASLAAEDHDLSALVDRRFQRTLSPNPAPAATASAHATLDDDGRMASLHLTLRAGPILAATTTTAVATGGAHMGLGMALTEGVHTDALGSPDPRLRSQGVLKEKQTPPLHLTLEPGPGPWVSPDEQAALAMAVVPAAMARAVAAAGGATDRLPMRDNPVAKGMGIRPPRPYVRKR
jgi:xanthine dehydrogenase molybdenum-binding subunit